MTDRSTAPRPRSSRQRYRAFVQDYKHRRLDDSTEGGDNHKPSVEAKNPAEDQAPSQPKPRGKRREYLREYLRWLWPHRYAVVLLLFIALLGAGLQMIEQLFMRSIVESVHLLSPSTFAETLGYEDRRDPVPHHG